MAMDALEQGLDDVVEAMIARHARTMAASMTEAQLRGAVDYLESPSGKAWLAVGIDVTPSADFLSALGAAARKHLCASVTCDASGQPKG
jgi:hypothetical protein